MSDRAKRILFLDVDGVLNDVGMAGSTGDFIQESLSALKEIVDEAGAEVVVSSSWRCYREDLERLREKLSSFGIGISDITRPDLGKAESIHQWMTDHSDEVRSFAIVDDDSMLSYAFGRRFVNCFPLSSCHKDAIVSLLMEDVVCQDAG